MQKILILGAGKIGTLISCLLVDSNDYEVVIVDKAFNDPNFPMLLKKYSSLKTVTMDLTDHNELQQLIKQENFTALVSCLPYFLNLKAAETAKAHGLYYFDMTEDTTITKQIKELAKNAKTAFAPQCGLAPGFVGIVAHSLMKKFNKLDSVTLRVGALPQNVNNAMHYALTWSTEGLLNQYINPCVTIKNGERTKIPALMDREAIQLDGLFYEAFSTSGGLGSLAYLCEGKVQTMNYKTIRYPGHCEKMKFLLQDLKLQEKRDLLKQILESAVPKTYQDVVIIYVSITGIRNGGYIEENYVKKIYPQEIAGLNWTAIQISTATGACSVIDLVLRHKEKYQGFIFQEEFDMQDILNGQFGTYLR